MTFLKQNRVVDDEDSLPLVPALRTAQAEPAENVEKQTWKQYFALLCSVLSPELAAIALVYFVQGILGISGLAISFYLKDDLKLEPAQMSVVDTATLIPWTIKPIYGLISDNFPIWGLKRRPYMVGAGLVGSAAWFGLSWFPPGVLISIALLFLTRMSTAFADVVADSLVVERSRGAPPGTDGALQSLCWGCHALGRVITAHFSGWLLEKMGSKGVFACTATFPLLVCLASTLIREEQLHHKSSSGTSSPQPLPPSSVSAAAGGAAAGGGGRSAGMVVMMDGGNGSNGSSGSGSSSREGGGKEGRRCRRCVAGMASLWIGLLALWGAFKQPAILRPALFMFLWQGTPNSGTAMFYFKTNVLLFDKEFLGRVLLVVAISDLLGIVLYNTFLKRTGLRALLLWGSLLGGLVNLTPVLLVTHANRRLGISDRAFALVDTVLLSSISQVMMMPTLVLSARICPEGVEATLYASLMSLQNFSSGVSDLLGGALTRLLGITSTKFDNLVPLMVLCNVIGLAPLLLLGLVPSENAAATAAAAVAGGGGGAYHRVKMKEDEDEEVGVEMARGRLREVLHGGDFEAHSIQSSSPRVRSSSPRVKWGQTH